MHFCFNCHGAGACWGQNCGQCQGSGRDPYRPLHNNRCNTCGGSGKTSGTCNQCRGTGKQQ